jgi:hypothetical protein
MRAGWLLSILIGRESLARRWVGNMPEERERPSGQSGPPLRPRVRRRPRTRLKSHTRHKGPPVRPPMSPHRRCWCRARLRRRPPVRIPAKPNANSEGKPNGIHHHPGTLFGLPRSSSSSASSNVLQHLGSLWSSHELPSGLIGTLFPPRSRLQGENRALPDTSHGPFDCRMNVRPNCPRALHF